MKKKILAIILSAVLAFSLPAAIAAEAYYNLPLDVGNHHRYGGGSHRSSGGSRRSYSGSHNYSGGSSSNSSSSEDDLFAFIIVVIFVIVIIVVLFKAFKKPSYKPIPYSMFPYNATFKITEFMIQNDIDFDDVKFLEWSKNLFITLQTAWTQRDWEKIRTFEKEELFEQHNTQLQEYIRLGRINVIENINILDAYLHKLVIDDNFENLTVSMNVTMNDYIIDDKSYKILMGNKNQIFSTIYQLTFTRRKGIKTTLIDGVIANTCPHCGASVDSASAGRCQYCGSIVHSGEFNWVLSNLESVDENFVNDMRGIIILDDNNQN